MRTSISFIAALIAGCGPLVQAQLEPVDVCWEMQRIDFPAAPTVLDGTWSGEQQWALPSMLRRPLEGIAPTVELVQVEVRAEGVENMEFIREARLRTQLDPVAAPVEITGRRQTGDPRRLVFVPDRPVDLTSTLDSGVLQLVAEISARLPQQPWTMVVNACYRAGGKFEWSP
jgi:hypothetical protein